METQTKFMTGIGQVVIAILTVVLVLGFAGSAALDWIAEQQLIGYFNTFSGQVASICSSPNTDGTDLAYIVLYPSYDIRYYSKIGEAPAQVAGACQGDKCACLVKISKSKEIEGVYKCYTLSEFKCNTAYELYFKTLVPKPKILEEDKNERTLRSYESSFWETPLLQTCKIEGKARFDSAKNAILYEKTSDDCVGEKYKSTKK